MVLKSGFLSLSPFNPTHRNPLILARPVRELSNNYLESGVPSAARKLFVRFNLHRPVIQETLTIPEMIIFAVHQEVLKLDPLLIPLNLSCRLLNKNVPFFPPPSILSFNLSYLKMLRR